VGRLACHHHGRYVYMQLSSMAHLSGWDVSQVTQTRDVMRRVPSSPKHLKWASRRCGLYVQRRLFNQDISEWNVSNAIGFELMFQRVKYM
jgi:hypothetical protein